MREAPQEERTRKSLSSEITSLEDGAWASTLLPPGPRPDPPASLLLPFPPAQPGARRAGGTQRPATPSIFLPGAGAGLSTTAAPWQPSHRPRHRPSLRAGGHMRSRLGRTRAPQRHRRREPRATMMHQRAHPSAPRFTAGQTGRAGGLVSGNPGLYRAWPLLGVDGTRPLGAPIPVKGFSNTSVTLVKAWHEQERRHCKGGR